MTLTPALLQQWHAYLAEEATGVRAHALHLLDAFIAELLASPPDHWHPWAITVSQDIVDHQRPIPVRLPLFRAILFPALHRDLLAGSGFAARALASFTQFLVHSPQCRQQLPEGLRARDALLREAVRRHPSDLAAKRQLRDLHRRGFAFSLHELPAGVLYHQHGATAAECDQLLADLDEYARLCAELGRTPEDAALIAEAAHHIPAYADYLRHRDRYPSFAHYLEQHPFRQCGRS